LLILKRRTEYQNRQAPLQLTALLLKSAVIVKKKPLIFTLVQHAGSFTSP